MDVVSMLGSAGGVIRPGVRDQLPTGALVLLVAGLVVGGAPGSAPSLDRMLARTENASVFWVGVLVLVIAGLTIFLQPFVSYLVSLLEGRAGSRIFRPLMQYLSGRQLRRRDSLRSMEQSLIRADIQRELAKTGDRTRAEAEARREVAEQLRRYPPRSDQVVATRLGNILRTGEYLAGARYGLNTTVTLPRLEALLPERFSQQLRSRRDDLDFASRFCATLLLGAVVSTVLVGTHGRWLALPGVVLLLAWASYQNAVAAAFGYGEKLQVAFDLHRFLLYEALHLPLPRDATDERAAGWQVSDAWWAGGIPDVAYVHGNLTPKEAS